MEPRTNDNGSDWDSHSGARWVANQAQLDAMVAVFDQAVIEAAAPAQGERVLDIGCGAGASSQTLAARVGKQGRVLGVDISEALIVHARALAPPDLPLQFQLADASSADLPEGAFDILFSRFGVMFFDDPAAAALPAPAAPGPFSFGEQERVVHILSAGGYADIHIVPFDADVPLGVGKTRDAAIDNAVHMTLEVGPLSRLLADKPDDLRARASAAVRAAYASLADA
eukprot:gene12852-12643_t